MLAREAIAEKRDQVIRTLGVLTHLPSTLDLVAQVEITRALRWGTWQRLDAHTRSQWVALCHDDMALTVGGVGKNPPVWTDCISQCWS